MKTKYPRTSHLPSSEGATSDDKIIKNIDVFEDMDIVATIKMDGENTTMYPDYIHARSLDSNNHPSRNWVKGLWGEIKHNIPKDFRICGENLYAKHSIHYENLESYFYVFNIWDNDKCLSLKETLEYCELLGLVHVPIIYQGKFDIDIINKLYKDLDKNIHEGLVIRNINSFNYNDFNKNVAKMVRANHVQTDKHWANDKIVPNKLIVK